MKDFRAQWIVAVLLTLTCSAVHAASWQEHTLEAPGPEGALQGTLLSPTTSTTSAVLIIPGSGPTDRDGNNPQGVTAATYKLLAEGLAERGIASVRIDKRGMFGSAAAWGDANDVTLDDYAHDVAQWIAATREKTNVDCVWVLGHSEGGLVALLAAQNTEGLCGVLLVATPGRPMGHVLRGQLQANPANAPLLKQAFAAIDSLEAGKRVDVSALHPALQPLFHPAVQGFLISSFAVDPARLAAAVKLPLLILQGGRDLQVGEADARRLHAAAPGARLVVLPAVNHVLKRVTRDEPSANLATYRRTGMPLAPGVVDAIADFVGAEH